MPSAAPCAATARTHTDVIYLRMARAGAARRWSSLIRMETIKLFNADNKAGLLYEGARDPESIIAFLNAKVGTARNVDGTLKPESAILATMGEHIQDFLKEDEGGEFSQAALQVTTRDSAHACVAPYAQPRKLPCRHARALLLRLLRPHPRKPLHLVEANAIPHVCQHRASNARLRPGRCFS